LKKRVALEISYLCDIEPIVLHRQDKVAIYIMMTMQQINKAITTLNDAKDEKQIRVVK